jgi:glycosyltransferase involved in cell wall biosynthesis
VDDGKEGFLRPVGDVAGMAEAAISLLDDPLLWKRFSEAARLRALREFPTASIVKRYRQLYEAVLAGSPRVTQTR